MKYFMLKQDKKTPTPPIPSGLIKAVPQLIVRSKQDKEPPKLMAFPINDSQEAEYPAVLDTVFILVNTVVKELFGKYDQAITFKAVMLNDHKHRRQHFYWLMTPPTVNCLANETEFYPDRTVKKLVLDEKKLIDKPIFKIGGLLAEHLAVRLDVAESLLRRDTVYGIDLKPILTNRKEE